MEENHEHTGRRRRQKEREGEGEGERKEITNVLSERRRLPSILAGSPRSAAIASAQPAWLLVRPRWRYHWRWRQR